MSERFQCSGSSGGEQSRAFGMAVSRLNNAMLVVEADTKQLAASLRTISRLADNISSKVGIEYVANQPVFFLSTMYFRNSKFLCLWSYFS